MELSSYDAVLPYVLFSPGGWGSQVKLGGPRLQVVETFTLGHFISECKEPTGKSWEALGVLGRFVEAGGCLDLPSSFYSVSFWRGGDLVSWGEPSGLQRLLRFCTWNRCRLLLPVSFL